MELSQNLITEKFMEKSGSPPEQGDLYIYNGFVYQYRSKTWTGVCPSVQPDLNESNSHMYGIGDGFVYADFNNMVAFLFEIARFDPRTTREDFVLGIRKVFEDGGWKDPNKFEEKSGEVRCRTVNGEVWRSYTNDLSDVERQLSDPSFNGILKISTPLFTDFFNIDKAESVSISKDKDNGKR